MLLNPDLLLWAVPALPVLGHLAFVAWRRERQRRERLHGEVAALRDPTDWNSRLSRMTHGLASRRERLRLQGLLASAGWREECTQEKLEFTQLFHGRSVAGTASISINF